MKKNQKIFISIIILVILLIVALGFWALSTNGVLPKLQKNENNKTSELGYVPGLLIIKQRGAFNVRSKEGLKEFKDYLEKKSKELTPIVLKKLIANEKLKEGDINAKLTSQLEKNLITYDKYKGNGYEIYLTVAVDNAVIEVAEELVKEDEIVQAYENGIGIWF